MPLQLIITVRTLHDAGIHAVLYAKLAHAKSSHCTCSLFCINANCKLLLPQVDASQKDTGANHAISALKFKILQEFLELNWHVLLSDVDIVTLQVYPYMQQQ